MELPRTSSDRSKVYSVIYGRVKAIVGDWADPQLMVLSRVAADELMSIRNVEKDMKVEDEAAGVHSLVTAESLKTGHKFESLIKLGLGSEYHHKRVRRRIWRQMIDVAHSGGLPSRQKALALMEELSIMELSAEGEKKAASTTGVSLLDLEEGMSFSGWELDCRAEGGPKLEAVTPPPPRVQGAVAEPNSVVGSFDQSCHHVMS